MMRIGFFDSGIGGLTVLHDALKVLPKEDYLYYADTKNVPYGSKPKEEVKKYILEAVEFIVRRQVKAVVVACNTATSVAIGDLRARYDIPIIGMEPAVKPAVEKSRNSSKRVLVTATELTLKEEKLQNLIARIDNEHIVDLLPLPGLVQFAENFEFGENAVMPYLEDRLCGFDLNIYDTIVLGCTHFTFYKDIFRKLLPPHMSIIDGNMGTVRNLRRTLEEMRMLDEGGGSIVYYNSGVPVIRSAALERYKQLFERLDGIAQIS